MFQPILHRKYYSTSNETLSVIYIPRSDTLVSSIDSVLFGMVMEQENVLLSLFPVHCIDFPLQEAAMGSSTLNGFIAK